MLRIAIALLLSVTAFSCAPLPILPTRPVEHVPYHEDGVPKPIIALISMINSAESNSYLPWHLDQELTNALRYQLMSNGNLFLQPEAELKIVTSHLGAADCFGTDLTFTEEYQQADYLIALELIEHDIVPFEREKVPASYPAQSHYCSSMLQMKLRLRIISLNCQNPRVILQEIFTSNSIIPKNAENVDYERLRWGTPGYQSTPIAQAHKRLIRDLTYRIETVIEGF